MKYFIPTLILLLIILNIIKGQDARYGQHAQSDDNEWFHWIIIQRDGDSSGVKLWNSGINTLFITGYPDSVSAGGVWIPPGTLTLGWPGAQDGKIRFYGSSFGHYLDLFAFASAADRSVTVPDFSGELEKRFVVVSPLSRALGSGDGSTGDTLKIDLSGYLQKQSWDTFSVSFPYDSTTYIDSTWIWEEESYCEFVKVKAWRQGGTALTYSVVKDSAGTRRTVVSSATTTHGSFTTATIAGYPHVRSGHKVEIFLNTVTGDVQRALVQLVMRKMRY